MSFTCPPCEQLPGAPEGVGCVGDHNGYPVLVDCGPDHVARVFGWYYGYPTCCVEAFIERHEAHRAAEVWWLERQPAGTIRGLMDDGPSDDPRPRWPKRPGHPISGHLLCPACEAGPLAQLRDRPAERFGWGHWPEFDEAPSFMPPSSWEDADQLAEITPAGAEDQMSLFEEAPAA